MVVDLSNKSIEQPGPEQRGYAPPKAENALKTESKVRFDWYVECVKRGTLVEDSYNHGKKLAGEYGFSVDDLENSLSDGLRKQFDNHLELIKSGRDDYAKIAITARAEAEKYGYPEQAVINAEAVGSRILEEIKESRDKIQKPDVLEIKIKAKK